MMKVLDLFSGIGGFSLGLERAGPFETVGFVEIDPVCQAVLAKHWPHVPCSPDIRSREFVRGEADVIVGGFPCQDISYAGKRAGLAGERSGLFWEMVRAIRVVRPRVALVENVAALLTGGMGVVASRGSSMSSRRRSPMTDKKPTYHSLHIRTEKIPRTSIFNLPFGLEVQCTRVGGWQLWRANTHLPRFHKASDFTILAGEYDDKWLVLDVDGHIICDSRPDDLKLRETRLGDDPKQDRSDV